VYPDSVHFYIKDDMVASNRGGFAVSGRSNAKGLTNDYFKVRPDSTRIYTGDTITGFGVKNINGNNKTSYMHMTPKNYFIGYDAGRSNTLGAYNSFMGYQCGYTNTEGSRNTFIGYQSGYNNLGGIQTIEGYPRSTGERNVFIGVQAGYSNTIGWTNIFIGDSAGYFNTTGETNVFIGDNAGKLNTTVH